MYLDVERGGEGLCQELFRWTSVDFRKSVISRYDSAYAGH